MDKKELTERSRGREGDQGDNQQGGASAHVPGCTTEGRTDRGIAEVILTERDTPGHLGGRSCPDRSTDGEPLTGMYARLCPGAIPER